MECLKEKHDGAKKKKKTASEESEDGEEEEEGSEEEEEEEEKKPAKRSPAKKPVSKRKKGSSDDEESASDDDASDEEYSPKKPKATPKKGIYVAYFSVLTRGLIKIRLLFSQLIIFVTGKPAKKGKKKGSDSDSDEDWGKNKKAQGGGGGKKGGGAGKGGYTRAITLSPELAAVVGAEQMARHEVVKKIWSIIKERDLYVSISLYCRMRCIRCVTFYLTMNNVLQDPKNKQFAICDDELLTVIGVKRFRTFGMMKYLKNHFVD